VESEESWIRVRRVGGVCGSAVLVLVLVMRNA